MRKATQLAIRCGLAAAVIISASAMTSCKSSSEMGYAAAMRSLYSKGVPKERVNNVAVVDFTQPSTKKRMTIYNAKGKAESTHLVAHGYGSGKNYAESFSNRSGSGQSSLGLYQIGSSYYGKHGKSLKLHGLEPGVNSSAYSRAIVLHSANYVSDKAKWDNFKAGEGWRIGRSAGCPAVSEEDMKYVLSKLEPGSFLYIYAGQEVQLPPHRVLAAEGDAAATTGVTVGATGSKPAMRLESRDR